MLPWKPRIGVQSITWGTLPASLDDMLSDIRRAKYEGVELYQHPEVIGPGDRLYDMLLAHDLVLVGLAGGSLKDKMQVLDAFLRTAMERLASDAGDPYAAQYEHWKPYIYVEQWEGEAAEAAIRNGFPLALHPHMFRRIQTARDAQEEFERHPDGLYFLPDTAHLTVAGEDALDVITRHYDRIKAIHLKDWTAEFGRAYQFYSKGFVELGEGDVPLKEILTYLRDRRYDGWMIVEQDHSKNCTDTIQQCRDWLWTTFSI